MRKLLVLACVAVVLGGCMATPFYSTSYGSAHPSYTDENKDGSTMFEFKFILDPFDARKAMQRIDEFLADYAGKKGFAGYNVEIANGRAIASDDSGPGSWVEPASRGFALAPSSKVMVNGKDQYGNIRIQVRFKK